MFTLELSFFLPFDNLPNSFEPPSNQYSLFGPLMRSLYSSILPVSALRTALRHSLEYSFGGLTIRVLRRSLNVDGFSVIGDDGTLGSGALSSGDVGWRTSCSCLSVLCVLRSGVLFVLCVCGCGLLCVLCVVLNDNIHIRQIIGTGTLRGAITTRLNTVISENTKLQFELT